MRVSLAFVAGLAITAFAGTASAYGNGASGYTGKQEGRSCNSCHSGGTAPQVTITGPDTLAPGATGDFTMVITTKQAKGAGGIAATDGAVLTAGPNLHDEGGELTHDKAINAAGGKASFTFKLTAPARGTSVRIYAVGLAANGSGTGGDKATQITKDITITGGTSAPAEPTTPPGSESKDQAAPGDGASTSTDPTEPSSSKKTTSSDDEEDGDDDDDESDYRDRRGQFNDASACSLHSGKVDGAGLGAAAGALFGLALLRRRRPGR